MLILHQSNRLEHLAQALADFTHSMPLSGLFQAETIVVQSQGMRRYISRFLAQRLGIAANIDFSLPARLMWQIMQQNLGHLPKESPYSSDVLHWRLLQLFGDPEFRTQTSAAAAYLASYGDSRREAYFDLAYILADIFDQYLIYRADWIDTWQAGGLVGLGDDEAWQADLWRQLSAQTSHQGEHRLQLWQRLQDALPTAKLPERIMVFGITSLAPMYLELFHNLSKHTDVHIFAMNPSDEYWGNIIEPAQLLRQNPHMTARDLAEHNGHPLLASLGKQGRDFFDALTADIKYEYEIELFAENQSNTLLARLQNDLLHLRTPQPHAGEALGLSHPLLQDASITINSAHSPLRELQILKDHIVSSLAAHPDWQLHDIAVLMPKVDAYLPLLEGIFGQNCADGHPMFYSVADVKLSRQQPLLQAIDQFLHLMDSRFELSDVLPLLDAPALQLHFGWDADTVAVLHTTIRDLNIRWGLDGDMRQQHGGEDAAFTWQQGLERVVMGWMLPQHSQHAAWLEQVPYASEPTHWQLLAEFWHLVNRLQTWHQQWQQTADTNTWIVRLQDAIAQLFTPLDSDAFALQQWQQNLLTWQQQAHLAQYSGELEFALVKRHIGSFLEQQSQAGFLRGGITVCSMVPMRGLPFKMLCLLGMNDGEFPRDTKAPSFDLIYQDAVHHHARKGDRSRRDDDRYLFLESILNAREQLYLSYIGKSIKNDAILAASTVVYEFTDTIALMTGSSSKDLIEGMVDEQGKLQTWFKTHPLQAFSSRYFEADSPFFSHRQDLAQALSAKPKVLQPFVDDGYFEQLQDANTVAPSVDVDMQQWLRFWSNPTRQWLRSRLQWSPTYGDAPWPEQEPFELERDASAEVYTAFCDARRNHHSVDDALTQAIAGNLLPMGKLSHLYADDIKHRVLQLPQAWFQATLEPPFDADFHTKLDNGDAAHLHISLTNRTDIGQLFWFDHKPNAPEQMRLWLQHLAYCAMDDSHLPKHTWVAWSDSPWQLLPMTPTKAQELLQRSLQLYQYGIERPLPFFARTSLNTAKKWHETIHDPKQEHSGNGMPTEAKAVAYIQYHGNKMQFAQADENEVDLVFGADADAPINTPLFAHVIEQICVPMYDFVAGINNGDGDAD